MRIYRILAIVLIAAFGALSAANTTSSRLYSTHHSYLWDYMLDTCRLKVESDGNVISFQPVGSSITHFQSALSDFSSSPVSIKSVTPRGDDIVIETLKVTYSVRGGEVVPESYSLTRDYRRNGATTIDTFVSNCSELSADNSN